MWSEPCRSALPLWLGNITQPGLFNSRDIKSGPETMPGHFAASAHAPKRCNLSSAASPNSSLHLTLTMVSPAHTTAGIVGPRLTSDPCAFFFREILKRKHHSTRAAFHFHKEAFSWAWQKELSLQEDRSLTTNTGDWLCVYERVCGRLWMLNKYGLLIKH